MKFYEFKINEKAAAAPQADPAKLQQVKAAITQKVAQVDDIDELYQIYSYVRKIDIGGGVDNILKKDEDLRQVHNIISRAIIDAKAPYEDKEGFAKELATKGIINVKTLLTPGKWQNLNDLVITKYPDLYKQIAPDLLAIQGVFKTGKTKTAKGPGEMFLAVASPAIMLSKDAGDLVIGGNLIEVKGNGGRIKGVRGYGSSGQTLNALKSAATEIAKRTKKTAKTVSKVNVGKTSDFWNNFGPALIEMGARPASVVNFMRTSLAGVVGSIYIDASPSDLKQIVAPHIDKSGKVMFDSFYSALKRFAFNYYKTHDEFKGILFLNGRSGNLIYIETADQFAQTMTVQKLGLDAGAQNGMQVKVP